MTNTHPTPSATEYLFQNNHIYLTLVLSRIVVHDDKQVEEECTYMLTTDHAHRSEYAIVLVVDGTSRMLDITNHAAEVAGDQAISHNHLNLRFLIDVYLEIDMLYSTMKNQLGLIREYANIGITDMTNIDTDSLFKDIDRLSKLTNKQYQFRSIFTEYKTFLIEQIDTIRQVRHVLSKNPIESIAHPASPHAKCRFAFAENKNDVSLSIHSTHDDLTSDSGVPPLELMAADNGWHIDNGWKINWVAYKSVSCD